MQYKSLISGAADGAVPESHQLDESRLEVGDVLLERSPTLTSAVIRLVDWGDYSHALVYIGDGQIVEAVQRGVVFLPTQRFVTRDPGRWLHLRSRQPLTPIQRQALEFAVRAQAFRRYSTLGAVGAKVAPLQGMDPLRLFCSQLVALCYRMVGLDVVPGRAPDEVTPNMLCSPESIFGTVAGSPFVRMDEADRAHAESLEDREKAVEGMEIDENRRIEQEAISEIGNRFVDGAAFVDGHPHPIGNLCDALLFLQLMKPGVATEVSDDLDRLLRERGYFDLFQRTLEKTHVPNWPTTLGKLWFSGRQAEAMQWIDECHRFTIELRRASARFRREAGCIDASLMLRLRIFQSFHDHYLAMADYIEKHCDSVDRMKKMRDLTSSLAAE